MSLRTIATGRVVGLWRHPVKSLGGEACRQLALEGRGVVADRVFAVRTEAGKLGSGKSTRRFERVDGLLEHAARWEDGAPVVTLADGTTRRGPGAEVDAALSRALGRPVSLVAEAAVSHFDEAPVHVVTTGELDALAAALPGSSIDARRFRPNVVIALDGGAPAASRWAGATLRFGPGAEADAHEDGGDGRDGDPVLRMVGPAERCRMVGLAQPGLDTDHAILARIARPGRALFGHYGTVERVGTIRVGDAVRLVEG